MTQMTYFTRGPYYEPVDMSGEPINPYNEDASEVYPKELLY